MKGLYSKVDKAACLRVAHDIADAFAWSTSPEGSEFWNLVSDRFIELAGGYCPTGPCYLVPADASKVTVLQQQLAERDAEIARLRRKLLMADFISMGR